MGGASFPALVANPVDGHSVETIFERLDDLGAGSIAVDMQGHVVWISDKYLPLLGLARVEDGVGHDVEEIIPNSLLRQVVATGEPMPLDVMALGDRQLVVTRMPIKDDDGRVVGAVGFVLFDRVNALQPLVDKVTKQQREIKQMREKLNAQKRRRVSFDDYIGTNAAIREVKRLASRAAGLDSTVLIQGETGTGKEMIAKVIHRLSPRAQQPMVSVHCAALSPTLLESELFGHEKGAFTGAHERRIGRFEQAQGGTLFLDEIGEIDPSIQVKLLRFLGQRTFERVGSNKTISADVRLIAATNKNLADMVKAGTFREDLFFRLRVVEVRLPGLRKRREDIPLLAQAFLHEFAKENHKPVGTFTPDAMELMTGYDWPGNVRELRTAIEHAVVLCRGDRITARDLPAQVRIREEPAKLQAETAPTPPPENSLSVLENEKQLIIRALKETDGNRTLAAEKLGMSRRSLHRKLRKYQLDDL